MTLAFAVLSFALIVPSSLFAQCQGNCQYCVEGQCTPKQTGWGHYQTTWRRWPEPAPAVQLCPKGDPSRSNPDMRKDTSQPDLELPPVDVEADSNPEFEHLKKRADNYSQSPNMSMEVFPSNEYIQDDIMNDNVIDEGTPLLPSSDIMEDSTDATVDPFGDNVLPETPLDLPSPDLEGRRRNPGVRTLEAPTESQRVGRPNKVQPGNTKAAGYFFPTQNTSTRYNPLRGNQPPRQFEQPSYVQPTSAAVDVRSQQFGRPVAYQQPYQLPQSVQQRPVSPPSNNPLR